MADRILPTSDTPGAVTGDDYVDAVSEKVGLLFDASNLFLGSIGGTANAITAVVDPDLTGDALVHGMGFYLVPASNNTGPVTLKIGSAVLKAVVDKDGNALAADDLVASRRYHLVYDGGLGKFVVLSEVGDPAAVPTSYVDKQQFTASGTWNRPSRANANSMTLVFGWGSGGGGHNANPGGGGGGGGFNYGWFPTLSLGATETVTVPAGGAVANAGGTASFGSWVTAYGGGKGSSTAGGGGGGQTSVGSNAGSDGGGGGTPGGGSGGGSGSGIQDGGPGIVGGGGGGGNSTSTQSADGGSSVFGGGGGAGIGGGVVAGASFWGGAGGGSSSGTAAGVSVRGGGGGSNGNAGSAPGGGGGRNAAGARGEIWAITFI